MKSEAEARRMLSRWIYRCPELVDELKKISPYFYKKKELSKKEVKLIRDCRLILSVVDA